jgi:hypothetical protein
MARDMVQVRKTRKTRYRAPEANIPRSQFNLSRGHRTTFDASYLIPVFLQETLPGDTMTVKANSLIRILEALDAPQFSDITVDIDFWWVPNRLVWDNWHAFLGEHDAAGAQDTDFTVPILAGGQTVTEASVGHYLGLPIGLDTDSVEVSALPFRGLRLIYNEFYRDQNLIDPVTVVTDNGADTNGESGAISSPLKSAKKHDYFTSALPYLQKGDAQNILDGLTTLSVETAATQGNEVTVESASGQRDLSADTTNVQVDTLNTGSPLFVDVSALTISVNDFRLAMAVQHMLELEAQGGTRPNELIQTMFGVTVPDFRVDRPEYLGGGSGFVNVSPVANTSADGTNAQGHLTGYGVGQCRGGFAFSFVEHGYVFGIMRARGELSYFQGLDRHWSRSDKYDFFWPPLQHLGEQPILLKEIYVQNSASDDTVFGYQERWAEYRYSKNLITGKLDPNATSALSFWHLAEDFASAPSLNQTFIEDATPMDRITTVDTNPDFVADIWFDVKAARPIPVRSIPAVLGGRF